DKATLILEALPIRLRLRDRRRSSPTRVRRDRLLTVSLVAETAEQHVVAEILRASIRLVSAGTNVALRRVEPARRRVDLQIARREPKRGGRRFVLADRHDVRRGSGRASGGE